MPILSNFPGGGTDTSDATAAAGDILAGKIAYANDVKETGTIVAKASTDLTVSGATVTAPAGYYASDASKSVATVTQATPSISVSTGGLITATDTQTAGYVAAGTTSVTQQIAVQAAQTITPSTVAQTIAAQKYLTGAQTILGDSNLVATNIKKDTSLFGVTGTLSDGKATPGETIWYQDNTSFTTASTIMVIAKKIQINNVGGYFRVKFNLWSAHVGEKATAQIVHAISSTGNGIVRTADNQVEFTEDLWCDSGDAFILEIHASLTTETAKTSEFNICVATLPMTYTKAQ